MSNALHDDGTARRGWFKFMLERRFASVSVATRPEWWRLWMSQRGALLPSTNTS